MSAKNINKKRQFKIDKKIFFKNPLEIFDKKKVDILFEAIGQSDGISKKIVETALANGIFAPVSSGTTLPQTAPP